MVTKTFTAGSGNKIAINKTNKLQNAEISNQDNTFSSHLTDEMENLTTDNTAIQSNSTVLNNDNQNSVIDNSKSSLKLNKLSAEEEITSILTSESTDNKNITNKSDSNVEKSEEQTNELLLITPSNKLNISEQLLTISGVQNSPDVYIQPPLKDINVQSLSTENILNLKELIDSNGQATEIIKLSLDIKNGKNTNNIASSPNLQMPDVLKGDVSAQKTNLKENSIAMINKDAQNVNNIKDSILENLKNNSVGLQNNLKENINNNLSQNSDLTTLNSVDDKTNLNINKKTSAESTNIENSVHDSNNKNINSINQVSNELSVNGTKFSINDEPNSILKPSESIKKVDKSDLLSGINSPTQNTNQWTNISNSNNNKSENENLTIIDLKSGNNYQNVNSESDKIDLNLPDMKVSSQNITSNDNISSETSQITDSNTLSNEVDTIRNNIKDLANSIKLLENNLSKSSNITTDSSISGRIDGIKQDIKVLAQSIKPIDTNRLADVNGSIDLTIAEKISGIKQSINQLNYDVSETVNLNQNESYQVINFQNNNEFSKLFVNKSPNSLKNNIEVINTKFSSENSNIIKIKTEVSSNQPLETNSGNNQKNDTNTITNDINSKLIPSSNIDFITLSNSPSNINQKETKINSNKSNIKNDKTVIEETISKSENNSFAKDGEIIKTENNLQNGSSGSPSEQNINQQFKNGQEINQQKNQIIVDSTKFDSQNTNLKNISDKTEVPKIPTISHVKLVDISKRITEIASNSNVDNSTTTRLILTPKTLGTIFVEINLKKDVSTIKLNSESVDTAKIIEQNIGSLRDKLQAQGITVQNIEVNVNNQYQAGSQNSRSEAKNEGRNFKNDRKNHKFSNLNDIDNINSQNAMNSYFRHDNGNYIEKYI